MQYGKPVLLQVTDCQGFTFFTGIMMRALQFHCISLRPMQKIFRLEGKVQHYAWGGNRFIPALLGQSNDSNQPYAEYWMGAHDNVPSLVVKPDGTSQPLNEFIKTDPAGILGEAVNKKFGRLPYLFKVLDVKDMLSIQVHPNKKDAETAFADENKKGIALNAPARNYKDDNHKPELMLALSDFWLLHGFKSHDNLKKVLGNIPELQFLLPVFEKEGYEGLYRTVMSMDQQEVNKHLQPLLDRIIPLYEKGSLDKEQEDFWAARAALTFNQPGAIDRGIFSVYFFNLLHLKEGEAIYQGANMPHAYLEGQNIEIMANSDNVLRGGLTVKHIDVGELMKHVKFEATVPKIFKSRNSTSKFEQYFKTPAEDFELRELYALVTLPVEIETHTTEVFFAYTGGPVNVTDGTTTLTLKSGDAMLATAGARITFQAKNNMRLYRATVPVKH
jgi:mannose-6-phosphate isomerase